MKGDLRKRKIVGRGLLALMLLLAAQVLHLYAFLPTDTLRSVEADYNTGRTEIVHQVYRNDDAQRKWLVFLAGNEDAVILAHSRFHLRYGWDGIGEVIDCSGASKPLYASAYRTPLKKDAAAEASRWLIRTFGRVEDPRIQTLEVRFLLSQANDETAEQVASEPICQRSERKEWTEHEGDRYFFIETEALDIPREQRVVQTLTALDAQGKVVADYELNG